MIKPRIALVHDHLVQDGGAERVLRIFHELFPDAPIYTLLFDTKKLRHLFDPLKVRPSFLQSLPFSRKIYQILLPLMPLATEQHDLTQYDIVISSSSAFSKGVITKSTALHICYCHTPTRYLWSDTHSYVKEVRTVQLAKFFVYPLLTALRIWDRVAADRVDRFIANSKTVQERIKKYYRRNSDIIYPPVEVDKFSITQKKGTYFLAGGRLVSYKRIDLAIDAFNRLGMPLKIFGTGPEYKKLRRSAKKNIEFVGAVSDEEREKLYANCIAYIHPQEEDLGITALEASAAGRPVIALAAGGALETIVEHVTGEFFYDQDSAALIDAVIHFKQEAYDSQVIRAHAMAFSVERFKREIFDFVERSWKEWQESQHMRRLREHKRLF